MALWTWIFRPGKAFNIERFEKLEPKWEKDVESGKITREQEQSKRRFFRNADRALDAYYWNENLNHEIEQYRQKRQQVFQLASHGFGEAAGQAISTLKVEIDPKFVGTLKRYQREMGMGLAEVVVKRSSNILKIVSQKLPKNETYSKIIRDAAKYRVEKYEKEITIPDLKRGGKTGKKFRLGAWFLMQARLGGVKEAQAKMMLPKPTPKLPFHKTPTGKRKKRKGVEVNYHDQLAEYTTRFIKMTGNVKTRMNAANQWYRFGLARAMEGVLTSATSGRGGVRVNPFSTGMQDAKRQWQAIINRANMSGRTGKFQRKTKLGTGYGKMVGTKTNPAVIVSFSGKVPKRVYPILFKQAFQLDREDMESFLEKRLRKAMR